jgi:magnesium transporter
MFCDRDAAITATTAAYERNIVSLVPSTMDQATSPRAGISLPPRVASAGPGLRSGVVNCAAYEGGVRIADVEVADVRQVLTTPGRFVWIGMYEPSEDLLREVQREFDLHDLAVEDAHNAHQRPKFEVYDDSLFVVLRTAQMSGAPPHIQFGETHVFVGKNYVVSVRHGSLLSHVGLRTRCEATPGLLAQGPGFVLYALMDFIVDQYFPIVEALEDELEGLEDEIFRDNLSRDTTTRIYQLKRELLAVKRAVSPLVEVCNRLTRFDVDMIPEDTRPYFRDVYDHVIRINDMIDNTRELLTTALEANLSLITISQNEDTKRLAGWAAIITTPTLIASIYGMNFEHMPEMSWRYGYPAVLCLMVAASSALYVGFKRSGWF